MRIAQVIHRYYPYIGGAETHVKEISEKLAEKSFEIEVLTTRVSDRLPLQEVVNKVKVTRFKCWAPGEAYYFSRSMKTYLSANSKKFDIVHAHGYHTFPALYAAQAKSTNKMVFTPHYHGTGHTFLRSLLHKPYKFLGKTIFEKSDKIVCVSNYEKNLILKNFGIDPERIVVIPNGINIDEFKIMKKRNKEFKNILYVGRLEKYKGVEHLIKTLPLLSDDIVLNIVGNGTYKRALFEIAKKLNISSRVSFLENLSRHDLLQMYTDADLFALLSKYEAFGICVAEALASGTTCIVAKTSALEEWIDNERCFGISYPINTVELAALINQVIGKGMDKVKIDDWWNITERLIAVYEAVSANKRMAPTVVI